MSQLTTNSAPGRAGQSFPWLLAAGLSAATLFAASKLAATIRPRPVNLRGKVALITGGSRGLGLALAHELGQYGCELALVARDSTELEAAAAQLLSSGLRAAIFPCDIT